LLGLGALAPVMAITAVILIATSLAEGLYRHTRDIGVFPHHRNYSGGLINSVYY
jgi:hypothetical protein